MKNVILFIFGIMILHACGYQEGIIQKGEKSFIKFTGNRTNVSVQIDDMKEFVLKPGAPSETNSSNVNKLYQVSPGQHSIKVYRDGELIVNRILFLDNQTTVEVIIP